MCVVCSHYQYSFLMFYIIIIIFILCCCFFIYVFFSIFLNERQKKGSKKKETKKIKLNHELNFLHGNLFGPIIFFRLINQGNGFCN